MKNLLYVSFDIDASKEYPCVLDEPYIDNFNEQIDSMSILIDNVSEPIQFTRPYHFVKVENKGEGFKWNNKSYVIMLLDNYVETETDIFNHIYKYQLNLMNVVKLLEKIQCPNLVITHSLVSGSKTIYQYIDQYMTLYSPKIKISEDGETWDYKYLFKWNNLNVTPFNDTVAADMQMNSPSLREVITNLMLQVGRIPTMDYRTLKFIDFREEQSTFDYSHGITSTTKSGASDSYANVLISQPTQVLDTTNEVITEKIGFRDDKNALIKQTENLKLQTRFPIYNIKKVMLQYDIPKYYFWYSNIYNYVGDPEGIYPIIGGDDIDPQHVFVNPIIVERTTGHYELLINYANVGQKMKKGTLRKLKAHICQYDLNTNSYEELEILSVGTTEWHINYDDNTSANTVTVPADTKKAYELKSDGTFGPNDSSHLFGNTFSRTYNYYIYLPLSNNYVLDTTNGFVWFECEFILDSNNEVLTQFIPLRKIAPFYNTDLPEGKAVVLMRYQLGGLNNNITYANFYYNVPMTQKSSFKGGWQVDMTPCFVEQTKRALLETNFIGMPSNGTLEELSQYIYGTVGYSIGGQEITGFSDRYSRNEGWWNKELIYFDNILQFIVSNNIEEMVAPSDADAEEYSEQYGNMPVTLDTIYFTNNEPDIAADKSKYLFDITYQPLNSFKFKLSKKQDTNIPLEVQQLNQSAEGLSEYSRLIKNNQDIINRVGNEILFIPQTISDISYLNKLNSLYNNKYTIFQRKIQLHEDYIECLYSASEKFVMQNYFTSIIQKYRAYQYVDYNQSVVRKENDTIYCLLSSNTYFNGDDKIYWGETNSSILLSGILPVNTSYKICYNIKESYPSDDDEETQFTKNELSVLTHESGFAIVYQDFDNVSAGPYILEELASNFWIFNPDDSLPGIVQKWQIWNQDLYNTSHKVSYANRIKISDLDLDDIIKFPILVDNQTPILFTLQTNKTTHKYEFYKDNAEVINQTLQLEFYCDSDEIEFTKNFIKRCRLINQLPDDVVINKMYLADDDAKLSESFNYVPGHIIRKRVEIPFNSSLYSVGIDDNGIPYIEFKWENISGSITNKKIILSSLYNNKIYDFIAFKYKSENTKYYLTLNDTKTSDVWYFEDDDELFTIKECANGINRYLKNE